MEHKFTPEARIAALLLFAPLAFAQTPKLPMPQTMEMGRQHPYISSASALTTQIVTTVYEVKFLRVIERTNFASNGVPSWAVLETNFATLRTNVLSVTQTNTPLRPE